MPKSAVRTGCVDYLLSPPQIAGELVRIAAERGHVPIEKFAAPKGAVGAN